MSVSGHIVAMTVGGAVVKKAYYNSKLVFEIIDPPTNLYFVSSATFTINAGSAAWDGKVEYSTDAKTWKTWDGTTITAAKDSSDKKYKLYFRGTQNTYIYRTFSFTGNSTYTVEGSLMSLLDYQTVAAGDEPEMAATCFSGLFYNQTKLTEFNADLTATVVPEEGYYHMFYGCTGLTKAPTIYAETVGKAGMREMFYGCTSMVYMQNEMYITEVADYGCYMAFYNCTALVHLPTFANSMDLSGGCAMDSMFMYCSSAVNSGDIYISLKKTGTACCRYMYKSCSSLQDGAHITCTSSVSMYCFTEMYMLCTGLTDGGSITLAKQTCGMYAFQKMYANCTALLHLPQFSGYNLQSMDVAKCMFEGCNSCKEVWSFASLGPGVASFVTNSSGRPGVDYMWDNSAVYFSREQSTTLCNEYQFTTVSMVSSTPNIFLKTLYAFGPNEKAYTNATVITLNG